VVVATVRALKAHSGTYDIRPGRALPEGLFEENPDEVRAGLANLRKHVEIIQSFGVTPVVAINAFPQDHDSEHAVIAELAAELGVRCAVTRHVAEGGAGGEDLAREVLAAVEEPTRFTTTYALEDSLAEKIEAVATRIYGADGVDYTPAAAKSLQTYEDAGFGELPVVIAKTHLSISSDPALLGQLRVPTAGTSVEQKQSLVQEGV